MKYMISNATRINDRGFGKPNEDLVFTDPSHNLFIILDGITREHDEYDGTGFSAACEVNRIFADTILSQTSQLDDVHSAQELECALCKLALLANAALVPYRSSKPLEQWRYYPGTVGILASLWENQLCCVWAGDCIGIHLQGNNRRIIVKQQTLRAMRLGYSKRQLYAEVCNHPENKFAYGVFNGDSEAEMLLDHSWTVLNEGDTVILSTDGLATYLQQEPVARIRGASPEQMLENSLYYDRPPLGKYSDDKAFIRIDVCI